MWLDFFLVYFSLSLPYILIFNTLNDPTSVIKNPRSLKFERNVKIELLGKLISDAKTPDYSFQGGYGRVLP
jgi:hypothetical protein